ncbi:MAG: hypothetical protein R3B38_01160 [Patescibacteria group bacterium]
MPNLKRVARWLWGNRKALISSGLALAILWTIFFNTSWLGWGLIGLGVVLFVAVWWATNFSFKEKSFWLLVAHMFWISGGVIGFVLFNIVVLWHFYLIAGLVAVLWWWLLMMYESFAASGTWPVRVRPVLDFFDLVAYFFIGSTLLLAADFYGLTAGWLVVAVALQTVLALYLRFWREEIKGLRRWLYVVLITLLTQEVMWVISFWHRGVYLKSFMLAILFYLMVESVVHYAQNKLTVRVALEYIGLVVAALVGVLIVDGFLVLR